MNRRAERAAQKNWRPLYSAFILVQKNTNPFFLELVWFCFFFFFVHPLVAYRLQKQSRCTWGLKDQQRSPSHPTHSVEVILDFQFVFFLKHNSVSFKTFFSKREKNKVSFLCNNNNKKNYRPLSRKKGKKVSLRISVRWPAEAAGVSVKVRDANTHWRRAWELQQHSLTPRSHGCTENTRRLSPGYDCQLCWKSIRTVSLLQICCLLSFSSHRLLKLTAADDGFLCSVYEKH